MGTEEDKTNNGVVITLFVVGSAAMLGGSAAIVGMTRTEMEARSDQVSAYADLESVRELKEEQRKRLREAKLPIDKAQERLLADIQRDPYQASWATPKGAPSAAQSAGGAGGNDASGDAAGQNVGGSTAIDGEDAPGEGSKQQQGAEKEAPSPEESHSDPTGSPSSSVNKPQDPSGARSSSSTSPDAPKAPTPEAAPSGSQE